MNEDNKDISIKEEGEGASVARMNTKCYCKMVYNHLNDNKNYKKLPAVTTT